MDFSEVNGLGFDRRTRLQPTIELTPMIDCLLLLIVFFLLATAPRVSSVSLELPQGSSANTVEREAVVIEITEAGQFRLDAKPVSSEELTARLRLLEAPELSVAIHADEGVAYQSVMDVILAVRTAGVTKVDLAYMRSSDAGR